jgi:hypothetical protein
MEPLPPTAPAWAADALAVARAALESVRANAMDLLAPADRKLYPDYELINPEGTSLGEVLRDLRAGKFAGPAAYYAAVMDFLKEWNAYHALHRASVLGAAGLTFDCVFKLGWGARAALAAARPPGAPRAAAPRLVAALAAQRGELRKRRLSEVAGAAAAAEAAGQAGAKRLRTASPDRVLAPARAASSAETGAAAPCAGAAARVELQPTPDDPPAAPARADSPLAQQRLPAPVAASAAKVAATAAAPPPTAAALAPAAAASPAPAAAARSLAPERRAPTPVDTLDGARALVALRADAARALQSDLASLVGPGADVLRSIAASHPPVAGGLAALPARVAPAPAPRRRVHFAEPERRAAPAAGAGAVAAAHAPAWAADGRTLALRVLNRIDERFRPAFINPVFGPRRQKFAALGLTPVSFSEILSRLEDGLYVDATAFESDVYLLLDNSYACDVHAHPSQLGRAGLRLERDFFAERANFPALAAARLARPAPARFARPTPTGFEAAIEAEEARRASPSVPLIAAAGAPAPAAPAHAAHAKVLAAVPRAAAPTASPAAAPAAAPAALPAFAPAAPPAAAPTKRAYVRNTNPKVAVAGAELARYKVRVQAALAELLRAPVSLEALAPLTRKAKGGYSGSHDTHYWNFWSGAFMKVGGQSAQAVPAAAAWLRERAEFAAAAAAPAAPLQGQ